MFSVNVVKPIARFDALNQSMKNRITLMKTYIKKIDDITLQVVEMIKHLGVQIDNTLDCRKTMASIS